MDTIEQNKNSPEAQIQLYENYAKADPNNPLIWKALGNLCHRAGRFEEAANSYNKSLDIDGDNSVTWSELANVLISQHKFNGAEEILTRLIKDEHNNPSLQHNLGLTQYYQKRWTEALAHFQQARENGLQTARNDAYIVYSLHHMTDTEQALQEAKTWLERAPGPATEGYVAMLEMDHGDVQSAYERAESVLQVQPHNTDASAVMGNYMIEQQEIDRALAYFKHIADTEPDNPRGWQGLGMAYMYEQNFPQAISHFEKSLALTPGNETLLLLIGWAHLANKDAVQAENYFRQSIAADRNFGEAHGGLATALIFQNRQDEAHEEIKRALKLDPDGFGAVFANSVRLQLQGKGSMGQKMLARLLEQSPRPDGKPLIDHIQAFARQQALKKEPASDNKTEQDP